MRGTGSTQQAQAGVPKCSPGDSAPRLNGSESEPGGSEAHCGWQRPQPPRSYWNGSTLSPSTRFTWAQPHGRAVSLLEFPLLHCTTDVGHLVPCQSVLGTSRTVPLCHSTVCSRDGERGSGTGATERRVGEDGGAAGHSSCGGWLSPSGTRGCSFVSGCRPTPASRPRRGGTTPGPNQHHRRQRQWRIPNLSHCFQSGVIACDIVAGGRTVASHARDAIGAWDPVAAPGMPKEERQKLERQLVSATYA